MDEKNTKNESKSNINIYGKRKCEYPLENPLSKKIA